MSKIGIIIQARMTSTRLPGKVLLPLIDQKSMLELQIERLCQIKENGCKLIIIVATTTNDTDDPIISLCEDLKISYYRGSENNVLERYYLTAKDYNLDHIIRITSDCPVIDPNVIEEMIKYYIKHKVDYLSNVLDRTYPRGLDIEIFPMSVLEYEYNNTNIESDLEHVTQFIVRNKGLFTHYSWKNNHDYSSYRLTVDTQEDLELIKIIYKELYHKISQFRLKDIVKLLNERPELIEINQNIEQKTV